MRRHGWQLPLHPLQVVGMAVFLLLVAVFYVFLGSLLGNRVLENTVISLFTFIAFSSAILFVRCTAIDPSDHTNAKKKKGTGCRGLPKFNYKFILHHVVSRILRKVERRILKCWIRRNYIDQWKSGIHMEPLLPFPLILSNDSVAPRVMEDDITYCSLCDFEVKKNSKHCRSCDRCVDGFDHHCRWLNNCIGRRNYTTFILLLVFILLMLVVEGGSAIVIFVRCFADREGISSEMRRKIHLKFPLGLLAAISAILAILASYTLAALGQLFFFHALLIRKGMRTYDYILAMREETQQQLSDPFDDSYLSSDEDEDFDLYSPENSGLSRFLCRRNAVAQGNQNLHLCMEKTNRACNFSETKAEIAIDPWKLLKVSKEKAALSSMKLLPSETKQGIKPDCRKKEDTATAFEETEAVATPAILKSRVSGPSGGLISSPKRRFWGSLSPTGKRRYRSNFDLKLTEVSKEMETYISKQVLCSVFKSGGEAEASPTN